MISESKKANLFLFSTYGRGNKLLYIMKGVANPAEGIPGILFS